MQRLAHEFWAKIHAKVGLINEYKQIAHPLMKKFLKNLRVALVEED